MRVIALIDDPGVVRRILEHLGRWAPEPAERGPPEEAPDWPRNALIPITTVIGIIISLSISGAVVTESLFSIPGMGQLLTQAVLNRDYPMVQGGLLLTTTFLVLVNILVDIAYALLDPRVRYEQS